VVTAIIHPVQVEISDTFKSYTDANSNSKMKEKFHKDFPEEKVHLMVQNIYCFNLYGISIQKILCTVQTISHKY
jgi:hypothetical protein